MFRLLSCHTRCSSHLFPSCSARFFSKKTGSKTQKLETKVSGLFDKSRNDRVMDLIFGKRKYEQFSKREKELVDSYQEELLKVDGNVILPNTKADLERMECEALLKGSKAVASIFDKLKV